METIYTWDNAETWRARPGADLPDLSVIGGAANPGAALQLLQALLLFQVWGFCASNKKVMHQVSLDIRTHIFISGIKKLIYHELYQNLVPPIGEKKKKNISKTFFFALHALP